MSGKAKVHVEYCGMWGYEPKFEALKAELEDSELGDDLEISGTVGRSSSFEVSYQGNLIFSKLEKGHFPKAQLIISMIKESTQ